jgi:hypothetical protein
VVTSTWCRTGAPSQPYRTGHPWNRSGIPASTAAWTIRTSCSATNTWSRGPHPWSVDRGVSNPRTSDPHPRRPALCGQGATMGATTSRKNPLFNSTAGVNRRSASPPDERRTAPRPAGRSCPSISRGDPSCLRDAVSDAVEQVHVLWLTVRQRCASVAVRRKASRPASPSKMAVGLATT